MAKFIITQRTNGLYHYYLKADNGQIVLSSEGYTSKIGCLNGVEAVKRNFKDKSKYDRRTSPNQRYYFNLKSLNGQIIGISEMYETERERDNSILSIISMQL